MKRMAEALRRSGAAVEYREYAGLGHDFGLGTGTSAAGWLSWPYSVAEVLREREREILRQIEAEGPTNTGSRRGPDDEELAEKIRSRRGLTFATDR